MSRLIVFFALFALSCSQEPPLSSPAPKIAATADGSVALDRAVLEVLYRATGGDNWDDNENWLSKAPLGQWDGVETNTEGRVTSLWVLRNNLRGTIPPELFLLDQLEELVLVNNHQLTGPIPPLLGLLGNLKKLRLAGNQLTGPIPSSLGQLSRLRELGLQENRLSGSIPSSLGQLSSLRHLWLRDNQLTGPIPSELGQLSLHSVFIRNNQLTGCIPQNWRNVSSSDLEASSLAFCSDSGVDLGPQADDRAALVALYRATGGDNWRRNDNWLSNAPISEWYGVHGHRAYVQGRLYEAPSPIVELALDNNNLRGTIPPELGQLVHLKKLYLSRNRLSGAIPPELGQLVNLRFLELQHNRLSGSIPPELGQLKNLIALWLGHNQLSGAIPPELGNLPNLAAANIIGNSFTGCLPSQWKDRGVSPGYKEPPFTLPFCGDSGRSSGAFNIELVYLDNGLSSARKNFMAQAARRWEQVIIGDLPDISYRRYAYNEWDDFLQARIRVSDTVDDVRIFVRVRPIASQTTTGSPTAGIGFSFQIRASDSLPILSAVLLNSDLLDDVEAAGRLEKLMLHELGHCLGVGISWYHFGLLYNSSRQDHTADTYFAGFQARRAFDQLGGRSYRGRKVPVQQGGDDVHWRTSVFGDELMTLNWTWPYHAPLSRITVASLDDIGYEVNLDAADAYRVPSAAAAKPVADENQPGCQIFHQPIQVVAEDGRIVDILSP